MNKGERLNQDQLVMTSYLNKDSTLIILKQYFVVGFLIKVCSDLSFQDAVSKYQEVTNNLEFAKELQRSFMALSQDVSKT